MATPAVASWAEPFRRRLVALGRREVAPALAAKVDLSGVVQQTLLDAHAADPDRVPADPTGRLAWLRRLFRNNLRDAARHARAARRDAAREVPMDAVTALLGDLSTPSRRAVRAEDVARLMVAVAGLPAAQRAAIELRYLHGLGLDQIADRLGRSRASAAGLLRRGLDALRDRLAD